MTDSIRFARLACIAVVALAPLASLAQNVTTVNGKPVPKSRVDLLLSQAARGGQQRSPELEARAREEVVLREIFAQEAEKKGIPASADYRAQMELVRQTVLIRELFEEFKKKNPVTEAETQRRVRQVQGAIDRHGIPCAAHPGGEAKTKPRS